MKTPIIDMLNAVSGGIRFCMPGHKGKSAFLDGAAQKFDITELPGADNLYAPSGVIYDSERINAEFTGAGNSFFLVNGGACGVMAALLSILKPGDEVIAARNLHLSAAHALALCGAVPRFITPGFNARGLFNPVTPQSVAEAAKKYPGAKAVYVTYPDYYGYCADLPGIADAAHSTGLKLICDAAHAATFDYSDLLPVSPSKAGCDIWSVSLHKTLPAMNQCAVLSTGAVSGIPSGAVRQRINMLQTTSPSYILLGSIDYALAYMRKYGSKKLARAVSLVNEYSARIEGLGGYERLNGASRDPLKLVIDVSGRGVTGFDAAHMLAQAGVYIESADTRSILLICGVFDAPDDYDVLYVALKGIKGTGKNISYCFDTDELSAVYGAGIDIDMRGAVFARRERLPLKAAVGRISTVCAGAYPPGVPAVLPGQRITYAAADYLTKLMSAGYGTFGTDGQIDVVLEDSLY